MSFNIYYIIIHAYSFQKSSHVSWWIIQLKKKKNAFLYNEYIYNKTFIFLVDLNIFIIIMFLCIIRKDQSLSFG